MTDQTDKRAERLKAALRENLRRRKAQVRGRAEGPAGQAQDDVRPEVPKQVRDGDPAKPSEDDPA